MIDLNFTTFSPQSCLGPKLAIDPINEEESYEDGSLMISTMPSRNEVTQLTITGDWSADKIHEVCPICYLNSLSDYVISKSHLVV